MNKLWAITGIAVMCLVLVVGFGTCARQQEIELSGANHNPQNAHSSKSKRIEGKIVRVGNAVLNGTTLYSFTVSGTSKTFVELYKQGVSSPYLLSIQPGDEVVVEYEETSGVMNAFKYFDIKDSAKQRIFGIPLSGDVTLMVGQEHLLDPSSSTAYKHVPGSLGYNAPSSLGPEFPSHPKPSISDEELQVKPWKINSVLLEP